MYSTGIEMITEVTQTTVNTVYIARIFRDIQGYTVEAFKIDLL